MLVENTIARLQVGVAGESIKDCEWYDGILEDARAEFTYLAEQGEKMRGFIITRDYTFEEFGGEPNRAGYHTDTWGDDTLIAEGPIVEFRLYTDDDELVYEGVFGDADEEHDWYGDVQGGAVLNFGEWDAGCTTIKVKRNGQWTQEIG